MDADRDWLDEQPFYEAMQAYRWADKHGDLPADTVDAFEAVKDMIRQNTVQRTRWPFPDQISHHGNH